MTNKFIGIIENNEVWQQNGIYLGEIYMNNYIIKQIDIKKDLRPLIDLPELEALPEIYPHRENKLIPYGYIDSLENI